MAPLGRSPGRRVGYAHPPAAGQSPAAGSQRGQGPAAPPPRRTGLPGGRGGAAALCRLSKKWLAPLFRGFHSSLAPTARPGSHAGKPLLRKAFCGFAVHAAKSDESLKGLRSSIRQRFLDKLTNAGGGGQRPPPPALCALCAPAAPPSARVSTAGKKRQQNP